MEQLNILHISDLHVCKTYSDSLSSTLFGGGIQPADNLRYCLEKAIRPETDCIFVTGDIVHEGKEEDYRFVHDIFKEITDLPVYSVLGNHDNRRESQVLFERNGGVVGDYVHFIKGYRIILMDSSVDEKEQGEFSGEQLEWLENVLKEPSQNGSILLLHHPLIWPEKGLGMEQGEALKELLHQGDIIGIFCGHVHQNCIMNYGDIPQIAGDSLAFGLELNGGQISFVEQVGYSICEFQGKNPILSVYPVNKNRKEIFTMTAEQLMQSMQ